MTGLVVDGKAKIYKNMRRDTTSFTVVADRAEEDGTYPFRLTGDVGAPEAEIGIHDQGTAVTPVRDISKPLPEAVHVMPEAADTQLKGPPVAVAP